MGLLSLFRKDKPIVDEDEAYARLAAHSELQRHDDAAQLELQRDIARATVLKIDAIEAAMAADMFDEPAFRRPPRPAAAPSPHLSDSPVTELLDDDDLPSARIVEEAALLHANGESDAACRLLAAALGTRTDADRGAWWILFDLYGMLDRQEAFDNLSIDYASTFETAPPPWNPVLAQEGSGYSGVIPTVAFTGVLDATAAAQIAALRKAAEGAVVLRVDFSRVTAVEPAGCALLQGVLNHVLQDVAGDRELILAGAEELLALVRGIVDIGRRDEGEETWLLILVLLRLLNREKDHDEAGMDYRVTFDVAPPPFTPPGKVTSTPRQVAAPVADRYLLPRAIEGNIEPIWAGIRAHAERCPALVFDCSRLARIEYAAAGHLLARLRQLAGPGRHIEFRELNHPVAALLRLQGYGAVARLFPHRY